MLLNGSYVNTLLTSSLKRGATGRAGAVGNVLQLFLLGLSAWSEFIELSCIPIWCQPSSHAVTCNFGDPKLTQTSTRRTNHCKAKTRKWNKIYMCTYSPVSNLLLPFSVTYKQGGGHPITHSQSYTYFKYVNFSQVFLPTHDFLFSIFSIPFCWKMENMQINLEYL